LLRGTLGSESICVSEFPDATAGTVLPAIARFSLSRSRSTVGITIGFRRLLFLTAQPAPPWLGWVGLCTDMHPRVRNPSIHSNGHPLHPASISVRRVRDKARANGSRQPNRSGPITITTSTTILHSSHALHGRHTFPQATIAVQRDRRGGIRPCVCTWRVSSPSPRHLAESSALLALRASLQSCERAGDPACLYPMYKYVAHTYILHHVSSVRIHPFNARRHLYLCTYI